MKILDKIGIYKEEIIVCIQSIKEKNFNGKVMRKDKI
jgi:hypothetical protein